MSSKESHSRTKHRSSQTPEVGFWIKVTLGVIIVVVLFFLSYAHVASYLTQTGTAPKNYALNLKLLSDLQTADDGRVFANVSPEAPCSRLSFVVKRDNLRSWLLFQGGMPSQLGIAYSIQNSTDTTSSSAWVYVPLQFSSVRGSVDIDACALQLQGSLSDTMVTATAIARVATFVGVVEEYGGAASVLLNAPPMLHLHVDSIETPTVTVTVGATDGPYTKVDKLVISVLIPQPNGTFIERVLQPAAQYKGPVTVSAQLKPGTYQLVAGAVDNYNNFRDLRVTITVP